MAAIDTKLLGKPSVLSGKEGEYVDWAFVMRSYLVMLDTNYETAFKALDKCTKEQEDQLHNDKLDTDVLRRLSTTMYHVLTMSTRERALRLIQQVPPGEGFVAWKRIQSEMQPRSQERYLGMLQSIITFRMDSEEKAMDKLFKEAEGGKAEALKRIGQYYADGILPLVGISLWNDYSQVTSPYTFISSSNRAIIVFEV